MKNYNAIDLFKLLASILVVAIHTNPLADISPAANILLTDVIARLAVPFFFMAAGFFLSDKLKRRQPGAISAYVKRLLLLYGIWSVIYLPLDFYKWAVQWQGAPAYWRTYLQAFLFDGSYYTLWFFPALICSVLLACLLYERIPSRVLLSLCFILYILGALGQPYYDILPAPVFFKGYYDVFLTTRNGLFFGFPFLCLGIWAKRNLTALPFEKKLICFALSMAMLIFEVFYAHSTGASFPKGTGMWIFVLPASYFLFVLVTGMELQYGYHYVMMRKMSTLIYLSHGLFIIAVSFLAPRIGGIHSLLEFLLVLAPAYGVSMAILKLSGVKGLSFLKLLYE